jgi:hypothetical protein
MPIVPAVHLDRAEPQLRLATTGAGPRIATGSGARARTKTHSIATSAETKSAPERAPQKLTSVGYTRVFASVAQAMSPPSKS